MVNSTEIANWLKEDFELRHGHAMAIYATFKRKTEWQKWHKKQRTANSRLTIGGVSSPLDSFVVA